MKHTCDQLGLCQNRKPRCNGCSARPYFAPGVIDCQRTRMERRRLAHTWAMRIIASMAVVGLIAFCAGYLP